MNILKYTCQEIFWPGAPLDSARKGCCQMELLC